MVEFTLARLHELKFKTDVRKVGMQTMEDGSKLELPPVIFATLGDDPALKVKVFKIKVTSNKDKLNVHDFFKDSIDLWAFGCSTS